MAIDHEDCLFCQIVKGDVPANIVFEDEHVCAFMDISPVSPRHVLVIPKIHSACLEELNPETGAHMFRTGHKLAKAMRRSSLRCEGVNLFLADGEAMPGRLRNADAIHLATALRLGVDQLVA